jgi:phosphoenolpyruvate carboxylase
MSTQHPDNANVPDWCRGTIIDGEAEIYEAYFAFSDLGCQEIMWDSEGKDVDTHVVRKLLDMYPDFFRIHQFGRDIFLTYRIPNPKIEGAERKVILETLQNIPVAYDVASSFYGMDVIPIFEVILPFTTDGREIIWLYNYYKRAIASADEIMLDEDLRVKDWLGSIRPKSIQVIPLIEDWDGILAADKILEPYIETVKPRCIRVFIARSDPALNYGLICAVLLSKIAFSRLRSTENKYGVKIYPILGVGSMPFRGHLSPENINNFLRENRGLSTVTIQSALKYDYPREHVKEFVRILNNNLSNGELSIIEPYEEERLIAVLHRSRRFYEEVVEDLAPLINSVASYVPERRARKLHIGLFGYSRKVAGIALPRAIPFAAALYSLGIPPEFLGCRVLTDLNDEEWDIINKYYVNLRHDLEVAGGHLSWQNLEILMSMHDKVAERAGMNRKKLRDILTSILEDLKAAEETLGTKLGPRSLSQRRHANLINNFLISYIENNSEEAKSTLVEAAKIRKCLG